MPNFDDEEPEFGYHDTGYGSRYRDQAAAYADGTELRAQRLQTELEADEEAVEEAQDRMLHRPHRYVDQPGLPGFCQVCRTNRKFHP